MDTEITSERAYGREVHLRVRLDGAHAGKSMRVLTFRPSTFTAETPILFVMHGVTRAADDYLLSWLPFAEHYGFLLVVPEFTKSDWPGSRSYNIGNMRRKDGSSLSRDAWSFTIVDRLFDDVRKLFGSATTSFRLYGHSAGSQFVHRFITFTGGVRVARAVAANAGWYTVPDGGIGFPYGLKGTDVDDNTLRLAFRTNMIVLLGADDNDPQAPDLRQAAEARAQGPHRVARGEHFIAAAQARAQRLGAPFHWALKTVEKVGHSDRAMAPFAAAILFPERGL